MNNILSVTDFRNNMGIYIDKIIYNRESYFLKKGKSVVAKIIALEDRGVINKEKKSSLLRLAGLWKGIDHKGYAKALKKIDKADDKE